MCSEELGPAGTHTARSGPEASSAKNPPDRARSDPDAELAKLALDPHTAPPRVLSPKTDNEIGHARTQRRPARTSSTVGPLPSDELAVPPKQCLGCEHERGPSVPREGTTRRREEHPIAVLQFRAPDGPPEDFHLMAENGVLELELRHAPPAGEHSHHADEHEVDEGSHGPRMLPTGAIQGGPSFGPPQPE